MIKKLNFQKLVMAALFLPSLFISNFSYASSTVFPVIDIDLKTNALALTVDSDQAMINGKPLRLVSENLKAKVKWNCTTRTVQISTEEGLW